jgi:YHS domain-containing protein
MLKHLIPAVALMTCIAAAVAIGHDESEKKDPSTTQALKMINELCAVMKEHEVDPEVFVIHDGKKIGFCCADCIDEFKSDPEKYMKDLK